MTFGPLPPSYVINMIGPLPNSHLSSIIIAKICFILSYASSPRLTLPFVAKCRTLSFACIQSAEVKPDSFYYVLLSFMLKHIYTSFRVSIDIAVGHQKRNAENNGRDINLSFTVIDIVLLSMINLSRHAITYVGSIYLMPWYIGTFRVLHCQCISYTIDLPRRTRNHPSFYVERLRPYYQFEASSEHGWIQPVRSRIPQKFFCENGPYFRVSPSTTQSCDEPPLARRARHGANVRSTEKSDRYFTRSGRRYRIVFNKSCGRLYSWSMSFLNSIRSVHSVLKSPADTAAEPDLVFPPSLKQLVDSNGGRRFHVGCIFIHRIKNWERTSYLVR